MLCLPVVHIGGEENVIQGVVRGKVAHQRQQAIIAQVKPPELAQLLHQLLRVHTTVGHRRRRRRGTICCCFSHAAQFISLTQWLFINRILF